MNKNILIILFLCFSTVCFAQSGKIQFTQDEIMKLSEYAAMLEKQDLLENSGIAQKINGAKQLLTTLSGNPDYRLTENEACQLSSYIKKMEKKDGWHRYTENEIGQLSLP